MTVVRDPWFPYVHAAPNARMRLFCLPYAGGSASMFRLWWQQLPEQIEVIPVQYPGREGRIMHKPHASVEALVDDLARAMQPWIDGRPFALFGHSLGGLIAFLLARRFGAASHVRPAHLIVSGVRAPHLRDHDNPIHALPDAAFIDALRKLNGTPQAVLDNHELMQLVMPVLRADFGVAERYVFSEGASPMLGMSLSAYGGLSDPKASATEVEAWRGYTSGRFNQRMFSGDHFFVSTAKDQLLRAIGEDLGAGGAA